MMTETTKIISKTPEWWEQEWYKEWLQLARKDYHGKRCGYWFCYFNKDGELIYEYVPMYE